MKTTLKFDTSTITVNEDDSIHVNFENKNQSYGFSISKISDPNLYHYLFNLVFKSIDVYVDGKKVDSLAKR